MQLRKSLGPSQTRVSGLGHAEKSKIWGNELARSVSPVRTMMSRSPSPMQRLQRSPRINFGTDYSRVGNPVFQRKPNATVGRGRVRNYTGATNRPRETTAGMNFDAHNSMESARGRDTDGKWEKWNNERCEKPSKSVVAVQEDLNKTLSSEQEKMRRQQLRDNPASQYFIDSKGLSKRGYEMRNANLFGYTREHNIHYTMELPGNATSSSAIGSPQRIKL